MTDTGFGKKILFAACLIALFCLLVAFSLPVAPVADASTLYSDSDLVYVIDSQEDFVAFSALYNKASKTFYGKKIVLHCDVDVAATPFFLTNFSGTLDGCGHRVLGASKPLFNRVTADGVVKNIVFAQTALIGSLIVTNEGTLQDLTFSGTIKARPDGTETTLPAAIVSVNAGTVVGCVSALRHLRNTSMIVNA